MQAITQNLNNTILRTLAGTFSTNTQPHRAKSTKSAKIVKWTTKHGRYMTYTVKHDFIPIGTIAALRNPRLQKLGFQFSIFTCARFRSSRTPGQHKVTAPPSCSEDLKIERSRRTPDEGMRVRRVSPQKERHREAVFLSDLYQNATPVQPLLSR